MAHHLAVSAVKALYRAVGLWVAGPGALFFAGSEKFAYVVSDLLGRDAQRRETMGFASLERLDAGLTWPQVLNEYETLLAIK